MAGPTAGHSRVVGFQPLARTVSAQPSAAASTSRSALTSGRPVVKSSTTFKDLDPPKDVNDEFKYLHIGDKKMKLVITRGMGPPVGKYGKEGRGKPKRLMVDEVGGRVEGFVEIGNVDACYQLELIVSTSRASISTVSDLCRSRDVQSARCTTMDNRR